jgi:hypothetical protein
LSGKHQHLPHRLARGGREPAHIGETLPTKVVAGNPEGSPSDPLTTDPKGEACHAPESPEIYVTRNTPALIARQGANGVASAAGSLVMHRGTTENAVQASRMCRMAYKEDHLQRDGLREIVGIAYQINLEKRRHSQTTLLKVLDEVKG